MRFYPRKLLQIGLTPGVVLAIPLMLGWVVAYWQISQMAPELLMASRPGLRGLAHYLRADYAAAGRAYRDGLRGEHLVEYVDDPVGYWALRVGSLDVADERARATLERFPKAAAPLVTLAEVALERNHLPQAIGHLQEARRRQPDDADALFLFAVAAARAGDATGAIDALNRGLRLNSAGSRDTIVYRIMELAGDLGGLPASSRPSCLLAHLHRYLRIFDHSQGHMAETHARAAIARGDHVADAYLTLGVLLDKRGRHDEALAAFRRAVTAQPRHAEALRWGAIEAQNHSDLLLEYRMITAAFEAAPTDPFYLEHLASVMTRLGDVHGMAILMERALALDDGNPAAHELLSQAAMKLGDPERARRHRERARALNDETIASSDEDGS